MSSVIDFWGDLGGNAGQAAHAYIAAKQAIEDRKRATAKDNFGVAQSLAPGLISTNPEAASHTLTAVMQGLRDAGYDVQVPSIVGGAKQIQRPSATPTAGPLSLNPTTPAPGLKMPMSHTLNAVLGQKLGVSDEPSAPTDYAGMMTQGLSAGPSIGSMAPVAPESVTVRDYKNPQTQAALMAGFGLKATAPKVEIKPLGNGGYLKVTTHPDGTVTTEEKAGTPKTGTLKQDPVTGEWFTPAAGATTHTKPTKPAGAGRAGRLVADYQDDGTVTYVPAGAGTTVHAKPAHRRTTTATIDIGGKPTAVLIDADTGDVIKEVGTKAATPKAPAAPKPWDQEAENRAMQGAKLKYPDGAMGANGDTIKKREAYVAEAKRQHATAQRTASGEKSMTQKLVEMMEADKKARVK